MLLTQTPLAHLFRGSRDEACEAIVHQYLTQGSVVVNFLYFANVMKARLIEEQTEERQQAYIQALVQGDFLLPDGIALQLFYRRTALWLQEKVWLHNLNGTDFIPLLLTRIVAEFSQAHIAIYSSYDPVIGKWEERLMKWVTNFEAHFGRSIDFFSHNDYRKSNIDDFPRNDYLESCADQPNRILLVCKGTPHQELRVARNHQRFMDAWVLVINAGGRIDYLSWFERRAPQRVVKARVLETFWRVATQPKKNAKKFLVMFGIVRRRKKQLSAWLKRQK